MQRAKPERSFRTVLLAGMGFLAAPVLPAQPAPCLANLVSPLVVPATGQLREVFIDDKCTHIYLANATTNQVEVFSLEALSLLAPIQVGSRPTGLDASPDGKTLYVANSGGNNISVVDLPGQCRVRSRTWSSGEA